MQGNVRNNGCKGRYEIMVARGIEEIMSVGRYEIMDARECTK